MKPLCYSSPTIENAVIEYRGKGSPIELSNRFRISIPK